MIDLERLTKLIECAAHSTYGVRNLPDDVTGEEISFICALERFVNDCVYECTRDKSDD